MVFDAHATVAVHGLSAAIVLLTSALGRSVEVLMGLLPEDIVLNLLLHLGFPEQSVLVTLVTVIALNLINFLIMINVEICCAPIAVNSNLFGICAEKNFKLLHILILSMGPELVNVIGALATPVKGVKSLASKVGLSGNGLESLLDLFHRKEKVVAMSASKTERVFATRIAQLL